MVIKEFVELPEGTAGYVIGAKGTNIKKVKTDCGLAACRVVEKQNRSFVELCGSTNGVEMAKGCVAKLVAGHIANLTRRTGYKPLFSLFVLRVPVARHANEIDLFFSLERVSEKIKQRINLVDERQILEAYALVPSDAFAPVPKKIEEISSGKQFIVGYDASVMEDYIQLLYEKLQSICTRSSKMLFSCTLGNTYIQPKLWHPSYEHLSLQEIDTLQNEVRHQFCSAILDHDHIVKAERYCKVKGFVYSPDSSTIELTVSGVHLKTKKRCSWAIPLQSLSPAENACWWMNPRLPDNACLNEASRGVANQRLGFISFVEAKAEDIGYRLEFYRHDPILNNELQQESDGEEWGSIDSDIMAAFDKRDENGFFKLCASYPFQIDTLKYCKTKRWIHPNTELILDLKQSIRFIPAISPEFQRVWSIECTSSVINDEAMTLNQQDFTEEVMVVTDTCGSLVDFLKVS